MKIQKKLLKPQWIVLSLLLSLTSFLKAQETISLDGMWRFSLDENNVGIQESWQSNKLLQQIPLPGTTDEAKYGEKTTGSDFGILTRPYKYCGAAWYQTTIHVPQDWKGKHIFLNLERVMWESKVFIDDKEVSTYDALSSRHFHDLGSITPGEHQLTIRVNNDLIHNIGDKGHVYTEYTQSIWNGIVGEIQLIARNEVRLDNPQIFTSISPKAITIKDTIINESNKNKKIELTYTLYSRENNSVVYTHTHIVAAKVGKTPIEFTSAVPQTIKLWDDISPNLYTLKIDVQENAKKEHAILDSRSIEVGFREIVGSKSKIMVNGKPVFFRGNLDCVHFPITGYPSCKVEDWERIFRIYKDYGLNHVRFHSWCPPEAAFVAANRLGLYLQPEAVWIDWWMTSNPADRPEMATKGSPEGLGKNPSGDAFIQKELSRMLASYGNHPSFATMCIGNELGNSDFDIMESWMKPFKETDSRRLYSVSSARKIMPLDQYMATHYVDKVGSTRGIRAAHTDWDFEDVYSKINIPIIAHEIGQWPVYPRWSEIKKYTGVLKARNLEEFKEQASKNKIENQNEDFVMASGALNQLMYKHEIESFLRTPSCAGIQLLSMQDYQGQGEALIGWLDVFYDSKGITTPDVFRAHHDTTVLLLRLPKYVWNTDEDFCASIQLAHYGTNDIVDAIHWTIKDEESNVVHQGTLKEKNFVLGSSEIVGEIRTVFSNITKPSKLNIELGLESRATKNSWNIWVYPQTQEQTPASAVYVADRFDMECQKRLEKGESVLLDASALGQEYTADVISFYPLYWSLTFFPGQGKNTIGMLVKDKHPAFIDFPTDAHSNWQWQSIYKDARAFYINDYPEWYKPMAQPVDDFHRNNKLASIFELKVGKGKLLVCGFNMKDNKNLVANQLKKSLINYMQSPHFAPMYEKDAESLAKMFVCIEPLESTVPIEFSNSLLYVEAGAKLATVNANTAWSTSVDAFELSKGTEYTVKCDGVWKDEVSSAWHGKEVSVEIKCPNGIIGSLYVFFHDWNNNGRQGNITFEGKDYSIGRHDKDGIWVKLHVMREDSNDGKLVLKGKINRGPNLMISKIALVEE